MVMTEEHSQMPRREFLKGSAAAAAGTFVLRGGMFAGAAAVAAQTPPVPHTQIPDDAGRVRPAVGTGFGAPLAGITAQLPAREMQFSARISF
jgi:hypothetical protein